MGVEEDILSCSDLDLSIEVGNYGYEGVMLILTDSASKTGKLRLLGGWNGINRSCDGGNGNRYSIPPHKKLKKLFFFSHL